MILNSLFEIVEVAGEYMAVPVGAEAQKTKGIVALNEAAAFLLQQMNLPKTKEELIELLLNAYSVEKDVAVHDVDIFVNKLVSIGVIKE